MTAEFVDGFTLGYKQFRKMNFSETGSRYFQVIYREEPVCLAAWKKEINYSLESVSRSYSYYPQKRTLYLLIDDQIESFGSRRSYVKLFREDKRKDLKKYMRDNNIRIKNASDLTLWQLLKYSATLVKQW